MQTFALGRRTVVSDCQIENRRDMHGDIQSTDGEKTDEPDTPHSDFRISMGRRTWTGIQARMIQILRLCVPYRQTFLLSLQAWTSCRGVKIKTQPPLSPLSLSPPPAPPHPRSCSIGKVLGTKKKSKRKRLCKASVTCRAPEMRDARSSSWHARAMLPGTCCDASLMAAVANASVCASRETTIACVLMATASACAWRVMVTACASRANERACV